MSRALAPATLHDRLVLAELDSRYEADTRRTISEERQSLGLAIESGDEGRIAAAASEAVRVAKMWGVEVDA